MSLRGLGNLNIKLLNGFARLLELTDQEFDGHRRRCDQRIITRQQLGRTNPIDDFMLPLLVANACSPNTRRITRRSARRSWRGSGHRLSTLSNNGCCRTVAKSSKTMGKYNFNRAITSSSGAALVAFARSTGKFSNHFPSESRFVKRAYKSSSPDSAAAA